MYQAGHLLMVQKLKVSPSKKDGQTCGHTGLSQCSSLEKIERTRSPGKELYQCMLLSLS